MCPQNGSRRHRTDFSIETQLDRWSFARVRNDANNLLCFQDLSYRHGDGLPRDFRNTCKPALSDLLAQASFIEFDDEVGLFCLEIRRRIVKRQMPVLSDADESNVRGRRSQSFANAADNFSRITVAVKQVILRNPHLVNQTFQKILAEAGGMSDWKPNVLIEVKHLHSLPVDVSRIGQRVQKIQLGCSRRRDDPS